MNLRMCQFGNLKMCRFGNLMMEKFFNSEISTLPNFQIGFTTRSSDTFFAYTAVRTK